MATQRQGRAKGARGGRLAGNTLPDCDEHATIDKHADDDDDDDDDEDEEEEEEAKFQIKDT